MEKEPQTQEKRLPGEVFRKKTTTQLIQEMVDHEMEQSLSPEELAIITAYVELRTNKRLGHDRAIRILSKRNKKNPKKIKKTIENLILKILKSKVEKLRLSLELGQFQKVSRHTIF